jgi:hypothetical protein
MTKMQINDKIRSLLTGRLIVIAAAVCAVVIVVLVSVLWIRLRKPAGVSGVPNAVSAVDKSKVYQDLGSALQNPGIVYRLNLIRPGGTVLPNLSTSTTSSVSTAAGAGSMAGGTVQISAADIAKFVNLTELNLDDNNLTSIPPEIGTLKNLQALYLGRNDLTALPPEIENLSNLTLLSLFENKLTVLPQEICNLANLKTLGLTGNPIGASELARLKACLPNAKIIF